MDRDPATAKTRYWNIWWTLTMIAGAGTIVVAILEALGVFHDLGIALSVAGIILSVIFGVTASTRSAVTTVSSQIGTVRSEITAVRDEIVAVRTEITALRDSLAPAVEGILAILTERLPRPQGGGPPLGNR